MSYDLEIPVGMLAGTAQPSSVRSWPLRGTEVHGPMMEPPFDTWWKWLLHAPDVARSSNGGHHEGRALLISYTFPPIGGSGVQRAAKLVKYLPSFGWQVEVLAAGHARFPWHDPSLLADLPPDVFVHRVRGAEPACLAGRVGDLLRRFYSAKADSADSQAVPWSPSWIEERIYWRLARWAERVGLRDGVSLWISAAVRAALRRHRHAPFDVIISTGPPIVVHQVASRLAYRTGLPWVADVRDPFVSDFDREPADRRRLEILRRTEQQVMRQATMIVTTCEALVEDLLARYPTRDRHNVRAITNGFDRDDILTALDGQRITKRPECVFVAAGAFYGRRELSRIVEPMSRVLVRHPEWQGRVRLVVAGTLDARQQRYWQTACPSWMQWVGYLDHPAVIRLISESACSMELLPDCQHTRQIIPSKLFELLALPTHLLLLVPTGTQTAALAADAGAAKVVPIEDPQRVTKEMERIASGYLAGNHWPDRRWSRLDAYDRRILAGRFAETLGEVRIGIRPDTSLG